MCLVKKADFLIARQGLAAVRSWLHLTPASCSWCTGPGARGHCREAAMRILGHGLLLGLLMSQAVQGAKKAGKGADNAARSMWPSTTTNSATDNGSDDSASSMQPSNTTNNSVTDSSFNGTSTPSGHGTEGKVCIELHFLIAGAVGIGLVSAVIAFHVSFFFKQRCKGKKKKQGQEEDQVSTQYASLQNLPIKGGVASRGPEQDAEKKTCYATIADIMSEPSPTKEKDTDGGSLTENP